MSIKSTYQRQRLLWVAVIIIVTAVVLFMRNAKDSVQSVKAQSSTLSSIDATLKTLPKTIVPQRLPIQHWTTKQGTAVYFVRADEIPMLDIRVLWDAGSARDGQHPGIAQLTNAVMADSTQQLSTDQLAAAFADVGAQFGSSSGRDMAMVSLRTLTDRDQSKRALALLTDVLAHPAFRSSSITRISNQVKANIAYNQKQPGARAQAVFYQALYGLHPYGHTPAGTLKSVSALHREQLIHFYKQYYTASNAVVAMVGNVSLEQAKSIADGITRALPEGSKPPALPDSPKLHADVKHSVLPVTQTSIILGTRGIARDNQDYAALYLANQILGGSGLTSLLMKEVRETRGLTYGVTSAMVAMQKPGPFIIALKTRNDKAQKALDVVKATLQQFIEKGPTPEQVRQTKHDILRSYPLGMASNNAVVSQLSTIGFYHLPTDTLQQFLKRIEQLTAKQVQETFARYVHLDKLIIVTAGPQTLAQQGR